MEVQKTVLDVKRSQNIIVVNKMNHPANVSNFLKAIFFGKKQGFEKFILDFSNVKSAFPNVCVPLASIITFYKQEGIDLIINKMPEYLTRSYIESPLKVRDHHSELSRSALDIVWQFCNSDDVNLLVDSFIDDVSKNIECQKGVIEGLTWCLNEVMDNVIQHSKIEAGYVMGQIHKTSKHIAFCISDNGQGIYNSLKESVHAPRYPVDAITLSIEEGVTRDTKIGQGNGMWGLHEIVKSNSGRLVITSGPASYMMLGDEISTFNKLPFLSKENPGAIIDFQVDCEKEISVSDALGGYEPVNLRIENLENDQGILEYKLAEKSSGTGTRQSGERIRNEIINIYNDSKQVIEIDFGGIAVISSSFADELIGKLVIKYGFFNFTQIFRLKNMNQIVQAIVHRSVSQRMAESLKTG
ncbi:STAS-like domain-containing protein [Propionispora vibrioides]|uniref:Histidine kinase-, DNA gyrase B-, and HSP90-like ATPase n=1 Tax=Propionispora vibrioides TaxID=112903 RepID=A0A1H8Y5F9_9FIRM|nr:DUF4325 domain-containing protein [Propionispora vibrioides]SEP47312.1 Histidine kinase-, DNA gyrase B-, and HSP90-like ATPase [Propionispora vibrioides]